MTRLTLSSLRNLTFRKQLDSSALRRFIALALIVSFGSLLAPVPVSAAMLRETEQKLSATALYLGSWLESIAAGLKRGQNRERTGVRPSPALTKEERAARVAKLELSASDVKLQSGEPLVLSAIPLDQDGNTIHGLRPTWESSDKQVIFIRPNGKATAGKPGEATITARAGNKHGSLRVTVIEGTKEKFGGKKKVDSTRSPEAIVRSGNALVAQRGSANKKRAHAVSKLMKPAGVMPFIRNPNEDPLPDNETSSLYQPSNLIGSPPGKNKPGAMVAASAVAAVENGNKNFKFGLPVVGLQGRGVDVSLSLFYNSLVWNKSTNPSTSATWMTYDVDSGYPAQGFRLGFGQIEDQGTSGFTLTDADGTRHALVSAGSGNYDTNDGTFIRFTGGSGWGTLFYPDGTLVYYGAAGGGYRSYPTLIEDRNGNFIQITYVNGVGPRIYSITDTVGRLVRFYYDSNNDLVTVTKPGLTGQSDLQVMRFYYETLTLPSGLFGGSINVSKPATARVVRYLYLPDSGEGSSSSSGDIGYRFDYSQYGMIYQAVKFQGMTASTTSTSSTGTVTEGSNTQAAITTYNYPTSASALTDLPTFSTRTDDWAGRTTGSAPQYSFAYSEGTSDTTSTVTAPDGAVRVTISIKNTNGWNNGLITETRVQNSSSVVFAKAIYTWEQNSTNGTPRLASIKRTNEAGKTRATVLSYDSTTAFNNVSVVSDRDFTTDGSISATELRRMETTYVTSSNYLNRRLLRLPSMIKVFPGGSSTPISRTDLAYDNYGSLHANMTQRDDIIMHDDAYDPFQELQEICEWECVEWGYNESGFYGCLREDWVCHF